MTVEGYGKRDIARALTEDKILIPSAYAAEHCPENDHSHGYANPYEWSCTAISYILEKQEYMGHTVLGKTVTDNFKTKKRRKAKPEELMIFKNTHEAIIDEETWNNAQRLKRTVRREVKNGTYKNRLTGLLYCADCVAKLTYRSPNATHRPDGKIYDSDNAFICGSYRSLHRDCTMHYIKVSVVEELIKKAIHTVSSFAIENEEKFIRRLEVLSDFQVETAIKDIEISVVDAGRYGFVKLTYYKFPYGFDDAISFTDSLELFRDLWDEWIEAQLLKITKNTPMAEMDYEEMFKCLSKDMQDKLMAKREYFAEKAELQIN